MFKGNPIQQQYDSLGNDPAKFSDFIDKVMGVDRKAYDWSKEVKNIKAPGFRPEYSSADLLGFLK